MPKITYDGGNIRKFHITAGDRNGLDQELVLALLVNSRLLLHGLQQDYSFHQVSFAALGAYQRRIANLGHPLACRARYGQSWGGRSSWRMSVIGTLEDMFMGGIEKAHTASGQWS